MHAVVYMCMRMHICAFTLGISARLNTHMSMNAYVPTQTHTNAMRERVNTHWLNAAVMS